MSKIILLYGGTGVGTSSYSFELAKLLDIPTIISTDSIREVIRSVITADINPVLGTSTFLAGKTLNYNSKSDDVKKSEILRGFKIQSQAVQVGIDAVVRRALQENTSLILEGVHLIPGKVNFAKNNSDIYECMLYISNPEIHKQRFLSRQDAAPIRGSSKYLDNFTEIRWVHDYLLEKGNQTSLLLVDNSGDRKDGISTILKDFYLKL